MTPRRRRTRVTRRGWIVFSALGLLLIGGVVVVATGHSGPTKVDSSNASDTRQPVPTTAHVGATATTTMTTTTVPPSTTATTGQPATTTTRAAVANSTTTTAALTTTSQPLPVAAHSCSASMSNPNPIDYTDDTVNITSNVPDAPMLITKYYKTTTSTDTGQTDSGGSAVITFYDSGATPGYTVQVDVSINSGEASCPTSFTPR